MADFSQFGDKLIIRISGLLFQLSWIVKDCGHSMFRRKAMPVLSEQGSKNSICCDENCDKARAQWCSWDIKIILTGFEKYGLIFGLFLFLVSSLHKMAGLYANRVRRQKNCKSRVIKSTWQDCIIFLHIQGMLTLTLVTHNYVSFTKVFLR